MPKRKAIQIQRVFYYQDLYMDEKGETIMHQTIADFIMHDIKRKCKLDEVIEETLNSDKVMMERCRGLLEKFDIRLQAHPERIVIQGLILEQVIWQKNAAVSGSASESCFCFYLAA
ncbi:MAG: hypothetical protein SVM79_08230 [Chloroflexota bacterium]|nr:hypothetical protein [Chloroflexota bacterium]